MSTPAKVSATTPSPPAPRSPRCAASVSTDTGSRSTVSPPGSAPGKSAQGQKPDGLDTPKRRLRITPMARQPEDTTAEISKPADTSGDHALIRDLALLLDETNLTEIEIE